MFEKSLFILMVFTIVMVASIADIRAESYRYEGSAAYNYSKQGSEKINLYALGAAMYFKDITSSNIPYVEDAFYEKAGFIGMIGSMGKDKISGEDDDNLDIISVSPVINYVFPKFPLYVELAYMYEKVDGDISSYDYKATKNIFSGNLGYFIINGLAVQGEYERDNQKITFNGDAKKNIDTFGAAFKYVTMISSQMAINIHGEYKRVRSKQEYESTENNNIYSFAGDFYLTPGIGIGGSIEINKGDAKYYEGNIYSARASVYFTPTIGLSAEYSFFKAKDKDISDDEKKIIIQLTGRI